MTTEIPVAAYPARGEPITYLNWHHIELLYDLETATRELVLLRQLCNQFVHSYVFAPQFDESGSFAAIYVTSDKLRDTKLLEVSIEDLVWLFRLVGNDRVLGGVAAFDAARRDCDVVLCNPDR